MKASLPPLSADRFIHSRAIARESDILLARYLQFMAFDNTEQSEKAIPPPGTEIGPLYLFLAQRMLSNDYIFQNILDECQELRRQENEAKF